MARAVIIEPDAGVRSTLREWLEARGVQASEAVAAGRAWGLIEAEGPAVVFCDARAGGIALAERLHDRHPAVAVVLTMTAPEFHLAVEAMKFDVTDCLLKPLSEVLVGQALSRALEANERRRSSIAILHERDDLEAKVTQLLGQLENAVSSCAEALLAARSRRDAEAIDRGHRIADTAVNLALILGLREPLLSDIELATYLQSTDADPHPDELRAAAVLRGVPRLGPASELAFAAHERFDGSGSPLGLRGEEIPIGARIIAVATAAHRGTLANARAGEFDPEVLEALNALMRGVEHEKRPRRPAPMPMTSGDPRRRSSRKRVAPGIAAQVSDIPVRIVDVSHGGFRLETEQPLDTTAPAPFTLEIPGFGVRTGATWAWGTPVRSAHGYWCGAAVKATSPTEAEGWKLLVDALPAAH